MKCLVFRDTHNNTNKEEVMTERSQRVAWQDIHCNTSPARPQWPPGPTEFSQPQLSPSLHTRQHKHMILDYFYTTTCHSKIQSDTSEERAIKMNKAQWSKRHIPHAGGEAAHPRLTLIHAFIPCTGKWCLPLPVFLYICFLMNYSGLWWLSGFLVVCNNNNNSII